MDKTVVIHQPVLCLIRGGLARCYMVKSGSYEEF